MTFDITDENLIETARLVLLSAERQTLKKAVLSKPCDKTLKKAVATVINIKGAPAFQIEFFHTDNKVTHKNIFLAEKADVDILEILKDFSQINVITTVGECEYRRSNSGKTVLLGKDKLSRRLEYDSCEKTVDISSNNRQKKYILDGTEPFLKYLDVSDANGRIYDRKQAKFRQINRFLEFVRDVEDSLPSDNICICDLCCGKSYLSFAVYHYFANVKGYGVSMVGVDLKPDVVDRCNKTARELGFDGLEFICGDVNEFTPKELPSLVISLHACDIATDFVLNKAVEWDCKVILSTPCCHHELNHNIDAPELSFITEHSMLRQKLCDAATDALRLAKLEASGYSVAALELIDPDETPKNIMLKAIKIKNFDKNSTQAKKALKRYEDAKNFLCGKNIDKDLHF